MCVQDRALMLCPVMALIVKEPRGCSLVRQAACKGISLSPLKMFQIPVPVG